MKKDLSQILLNNLNYEIGEGRSFGDGSSANDVLDGYTCYFQKLPKASYQQYLGYGRRFYEGDQFPAVQMLWPNTFGVYPWDKQADDYLRWVQPVLTDIPPTAP